MHCKLFAIPILAISLFAAAFPAFSQVVPAATRGVSWPLEVGAGFSDYNIDWGGGLREDGGTVTADWTIRQMPRMLQGLGVGIVGRDLVVDPPASLSFFQYKTVGGGAIYHYLRPRNIVPYAKGGEGYGRIKFLPGYAPGNYHSDTRSFFYMGGGADFHAWHHIWVRADYEYQIWQHLFGSPHALTPNGFTIGPEYDFGTFRAR